VLLKRRKYLKKSHKLLIDYEIQTAVTLLKKRGKSNILCIGTPTSARSDMLIKT